MATCKDCLHEKVCDALIKSGCPYLDEEIPADVFCMAFKNKADVVPKSEVEVLYTKIIHLEEDYGSLFANYLKAKSEVAREIFEDLEMYVEEHNGCSVNLSRCEFADLKKKYTGGKT